MRPSRLVLTRTLMSLLNRNRYRKKLRELLSIADDEAFFQMVWAIDALQSGRADAAAHCIRFPQEAATSDMSSRFAVYKWDLETLIGQLLITPKSKRRNSSIPLLNCTRFAAGATAVNHLRKLEDAEVRIYLEHSNALREVHRIGQRQFPWQRGYFDVVQLYRYAYIYGQGECAAYFERTCGLTINDFSLIGFALYAGFQGHPGLNDACPWKNLALRPPPWKQSLCSCQSRSPRPETKWSC